MGVFHIRAAYAVTAGGPGPKAVLMCMADRACDVCGLAWPGVAYLAERTEMLDRRVSRHLAALVEAGIIAVHGYSSGGRGRTTEYIVLPQVAKLSTAPCENCGKRRQTLSPRAGFKAGNPVKTSTGNPVTTSTPSISIYPSVDPSAEPTRKPGPNGRAGAQHVFEPETPELPTIPTESARILSELGLRSPTGHGALREAPKPAPDPSSPQAGKDGSVDAS